MADLTIEVRKVEGLPATSIVTLSGPIDSRSVMSFKSRLEAERTKGVRTFVLDLEHVPYINSTGLSYLINLADTGDPAQPGILLVRTQAKVKVLFDMMGLGAIFRFQASMEEALTALGGAAAPLNPPASVNPVRAVPPAERTPVPAPKAADDASPPAVPSRIRTPVALPALGRGGEVISSLVSGDRGPQPPSAEPSVPREIPPPNLSEIRPPSPRLEGPGAVSPSREEIASVLVGLFCAGLAAMGLWPIGPSFRWASDGDFFAAVAHHVSVIDRLAAKAKTHGLSGLGGAIDEFRRAYECGDRTRAAEAADRLREIAGGAIPIEIRDEFLRLDQEVFSLAKATGRRAANRRNLLESALQGFVCFFLACLGIIVMRGRLGRFVLGFFIVFSLGWLARWMAGNVLVRSWGLDPFLAALFLGLFLGSSFSIPPWMQEAVRGGYYLRVGLVVLGADIFLPERISPTALGFAALLILAVGMAGTVICRWLRLEGECSAVISFSIPSGGLSGAIASLVAVRAHRHLLAYLAPLIFLSSFLLIPVVRDLAQRWGFTGPAAEAWRGGILEGPAGVLSEAARAVEESRGLLIPLLALALSLIWGRRRLPRPGNLPPAAHYPWSVAGFVVVFIVFGAVLPALGAVGSPSPRPIIHEPWLVLAFVCLGLETRWGHLVRLRSGRPALAFLAVQLLRALVAAGLAWALYGGGLFTAGGSAKYS